MGGILLAALISAVASVLLREVIAAVVKEMHLRGDRKAVRQTLAAEAELISRFLGETHAKYAQVKLATKIQDCLHLLANYAFPDPLSLTVSANMYVLDSRTLRRVSISFGATREIGAVARALLQKKPLQNQITMGEFWHLMGLTAEAANSLSELADGLRREVGTAGPHEERELARDQGPARLDT